MLEKSRFKYHDVTTVRSSGHVTSSGTCLLDSTLPLSYRLLIGKMPLSGLVSEIFSDKDYYIMTSLMTS